MKIRHVNYTLKTGEVMQVICSGLHLMPKTVTIELSPDDITREFGDKFFMKKGDDGNLHLPADHQYYSQVQGEMAIIGVEWCDFVFYSNGCAIIDQILANLDYWNNLMEKLEHFNVTRVIPEILSGRIFLEEF